MTNRVTFSVFMMVLLTMVSFTTYAQVPTSVKIEGKLLQGNPEDCAAQSAGEVTFFNFIGQSSDIWGDPVIDTIFLCAEDQFNLLISGQDLSGDPDMSTSAGVGYALYTGPPAVAGSDLAAVDLDPHYSFGGEFLVSTGCDTTGVQTFKNTGSLQGLLWNGDPGCVWFAPITYDKLDSTGNCTAVYEGGGACVKVSIDEAFPVVYLNALQAADLKNNESGFGCQGSFIVKGGLPEFYDDAQYDIDISLISDSSKKGILFGGNFEPGQLVQFEVGEAGTYKITISDGKSCTFTTTVDMAGCPMVSIDMIDTVLEQGSSICIPLTVRDFDNIAAFEFVISWDSTVIAFDQLVFGPGLEPAPFFNTLDTAHLVVLWANSDGLSMADGDTLLLLCFDVIGPLGSSTPITIGPNTNGISFSDPDFNLIGFDYYGSKHGKITVINPDVMTISLDSAKVVCKGDQTGSISATVYGGGGFPVTLDWSEAGGTPSGSESIAASGQTANITDLPAGMYNLHFIDGAGGVLDTTISVLDGKLLGANFQGVTSVCHGDIVNICPTVSIDYEAITNLTGYSFLWYNGSTTMCQDTILEGFFSVTVTAPNGCVATTSATLNQKTKISPNADISHPTCEGISNGQVEIIPSGGMPYPGDEYEILWDGILVDTITSSTITSLGEGGHLLTIRDANGCEVSDSIILVYEKELQINATGQNITCAGSDDGQIGAQAVNIGGASAPPFAWIYTPPIAGVSYPTADSMLAVSLAPGTYGIQVTDADGCIDTTSVVLTQPDSMIITLDSIWHESCTTGGDGFISISVTGGGGNYSYSWTNLMTVPTIGGLSAGTHNVTVTDANGCMKVASYEIFPPTPPVIDGFTKVNVNCPEDNTGSLVPTVTNGNGTNILYSWSNGSNVASISGLTPGVYCLTITDEYGCQANTCDTIISTQGFYIADTTYTRPICPGEANGQISVTMSDATQPYDFSWEFDSANHTNILLNAPAGAYNVTITGTSSVCAPINATFTLQDPPSIVSTMTLLDGVSCFDGSITDGSAVVTVMYSDSTAGMFDIEWPGYSCQGANSCTPTNLSIGENIVTIDDGVCSIKDTVWVTSPDSIKITKAITNATCYGYSDGAITIDSVTGGVLTSSADYAYGWSPTGQSGPELTAVVAGNYDLVVSDDVGCSELFHLVIDEPDSLELLLDLTKTVDVYCYGDSTGQIFVQPVGGNASTGYTYAWTPNISDSNVASFLLAGTYVVTVTDGLGCSQELTHVVGQNDPIVATLDPIIEPECFGYQTLISIDTVIGGSGGPYTFSVDFSPPKSTQLDFPVFAGSHVVRVLDVYECVSEYNVDIDEPEEIYIELPTSIEVELGDSIQLNPVISSALPIDSFFWTPIINLMPDSVLHPQVVGLTHDQDYELVVVDANGCSKDASILVEVDRNRNVYIPNIFSPNNDGFNDVFFPKTGIGVEQVNFMTVYDRWGDVIYEAKDFLPGDNSTQSWNGLYKGKALSPGVYIYLIEVEFLDGVKLLYRGDITLLR